jgi:UDP-galactopyranose mutase
VKIEEQTQAPGVSRWPAVIIGAGPTGLSAAYHLGEQSLLIEQQDTVGGWCRSIEEAGFTFDYAGHIMFTKDEYVLKLYEMLLGDNMHWQDREAWVYSKKVYTRYPFQGALYGLPPEVIKECIMGAIEARYGSLDGEQADSSGSGSLTVATKNGNSNGNGHAHASNGNGNGNGHTHAANGNTHINSQQPAAGGVTTLDRFATITNGHSKELLDCCADGTVESINANGHSANCPVGGGKDQTNIVTEHSALSSQPSALGSEPRNFEEFIYKVWGKGIAKHFAIPYNRKIWAVPLNEMETSWLGGRVPLPNLEEMIDGALQPVAKPMGPNARFGYPLRGGFQALMDGFLPHLEGELKMGTRVTRVSPSQRSISLSDGSVVEYEHLISTMPLPTLVKLTGNEAPEAVKKAAAGLRHTSVRCVNIGVGRENLTEKHWIYYPEDTVFHRIFVQGNASPHCNPPGGFGITCEITYSPYKPLPCDGEELIKLCIEDCKRVGIFNEDDPILVANMVDMPYAYVVYDHARANNVETIREWLKGHNIILAGRYSEWEYYNSDHAFTAGKKAADTVMELQAEEQAALGTLAASSTGYAIG